MLGMRKDRIIRNPKKRSPNQIAICSGSNPTIKAATSMIVMAAMDTSVVNK
jgi:hypothetical protein